MLDVDWIYGAAGSAAIAGAAYWRRSLSGSGAVAAILLGTAMYALGSLSWFGTLIAFFVSSTAWSKWKRRKKAAAESGYAKTGRRDAGQVLANGGLALLLCAANAVYAHPGWWAAFLGVLAAVNADTWATEIGSLSPSAPRSLLTWRKVPPGTSGGVSLLGTAAAVAGGLFIGAAAWMLIEINPGQIGSAIAAGSPVSWQQLLLIGCIGGLAGSFADSFIGAKWQVMFRCSRCGKEVEHRRHCGVQAGKVHGLRFMNNDAVNLLASAVGGAAGLFCGFMVSGGNW